MWIDADAQYVPVTGTGVISCRGLTEEQGKEAEDRSIPIGFRLQPILRPALERAAEEMDERVGYLVKATMSAHAARLEEEIVAELATWGECAWTARDCFVIVDRPEWRCYSCGKPGGSPYRGCLNPSAHTHTIRPEGDHD